MAHKDIMMPAARSPRREQGAGRSIVYLACPYTHPDSKIRERRFQAATDAAAALIKKGYVVYSPITMTHPIDVALAGQTATLGSDYWVAFDEAFMDVCSEIIILTIDGWEQSSGIRREREYFRNQGKTVTLLDPAEVLASQGRGADEK